MRTNLSNSNSLWAIIPVKPFVKGKSRLSKVLTDIDREKLNQTLLKKTLEIINKVRSIDNIVVVSWDISALIIAKEYGAYTLLESRRTEINQAIRRAVIWLSQRGVSKALILPTDLPLLTVKDVESFLQLSANSPEIVITPDYHLQGTNALLVNPLGVLQFEYGENSFNKHIEQAKSKSINVHIYYSKNIGHDLDASRDLGFVEKNGFRLMKEKK